MALAPGSRLGPYEIASPLGEGGMGEVYRAKDTRLDRTVALKVLSSKLEASPELQARFEREARAIAALQHPNICVLYDLGHEASTSFLVMEYLEGETLAARLRRGPLPQADLVAIGGQIAAALERAHRAGIVHRDLKPANIMLTKAGAKLLDFGLARTRITSSLVPTALDAATQAGAVLGTIPYMAPEQLEGAEADVRSDVFAFGCVLYEMATGEPAYRGTHAVEPPALDRLLRACLARDPEQRLQSAHDAGLMLAAVPEAPPTAPAGPASRWPLLAALAAAVVLAVYAFWPRPAPSAARTITEITPPPGQHFDFGGSFPGPAVISPDGRKVVFSAADASGQLALWLRSLDSPEAHKLPGSQYAIYPFWSPDSQSVGFFTQLGQNTASSLMTLSLAGGLPKPVAPIVTARGGSWSSDGTIVYAPSVTGGLFRVSAAGGTPQPAGTCDPAQFSSCRFPYFLPDGRHFLYLAISHDDSGKDMLFLASLDGRLNKPLVHSITGGIYSNGYLLYSADGTLMAEPLNASTGVLGGSPVPVATGVFDDAVTWRPAYSVSRTGLLVYASGSMGAEQAMWVDRAGKPGAPLASYAGELFSASVSPDGGSLALSIDNGLQDVWTQPLSGGSRTRLTFGPVSNLDPVWSPDGRWIAYAGGIGSASTLMRRPAGGGSESKIAVPAEGGGFFPMAWSSDGREILCRMAGLGHDSITAVAVAGGAVRTIAARADLAILQAGLSPDNRWVSYVASDSGQPANLYVVPFRGPSGSVWQVTTAGAIAHFWVKGGRELDVIDGSGRLLAIPVSESGGAPVFGAPQVLANNFPPTFAATPDGSRFLVASFPNDHQRLMVESNWQAGLRR